jgi:hypothetical protein
MAKGWMSKDPSEMTARQQRRMQFLEKRGRGGKVSGQPTEMPEMTARQQRRQQYLQRRDARRQRALEDWRSQQQAQQQMPSFQPGMGLGEFLGQLPEGLDPRANIHTGEIQQDTPGLDVGMPIVPYSPNMTGGYKGSLELTPEQAQRMREFMLRGGFTNAGYGNMLGQLPAGQTQGQAVGAAMGQRGVNAARPYGTNHWSYNRR